MATRKRTISVRLDDEAKQRVARAAKLVRQSSGAFLEKAGEERARQVLLEWAVNQYLRGAASLSELAEETALAVEQIMAAVGVEGRADALEMFLASCRTVAETQGKPEFLRQAQEAVQAVGPWRQETPPKATSPSSQ